MDKSSLTGESEQCACAQGFICVAPLGGREQPDWRVGPGEEGRHGGPHGPLRHPRHGGQRQGPRHRCRGQLTGIKNKTKLQKNSKTTLKTTKNYKKLQETTKNHK